MPVFPGRKHPSYQQYHLAQRLVSVFANGHRSCPLVRDFLRVCARRSSGKSKRSGPLPSPLPLSKTPAPPPATVSNAEILPIPPPEEKGKGNLPFTPGVIKALDSKLTFEGADGKPSLVVVNSPRTPHSVNGSFGVPIPTDA